MQEEERVRRCLIRLPETLRSALLLRYQEDLSLAEVAAILRVGLSAAKMRVQRGLNLLKQCLERQAEESA
jgi:RNA polymerase sigma-70 factor (ECF subfamily)